MQNYESLLPENKNLRLLLDYFSETQDFF